MRAKIIFSFNLSDNMNICLSFVADAYLRVKMEEDVEPVIFNGAEMVDVQNDPSPPATEDQAQVNNQNRYLAAVVYGKIRRQFNNRSPIGSKLTFVPFFCKKNIFFVLPYLPETTN